MFHKLKLYLVTLLILSSCSDNSPKIKKVIVKDNSARLIDNPKTKSPITFVPIGTELEVINIKDMKKGLFNTTWFQVVYEDTVGWINMFFVTVDSNATIEDMKKIVNKNIPAENFEDSDELFEDNEEINDLNESSAFEEDIANLNDDINDEIIGQNETDDLDKSLITKFILGKISRQLNLWFVLPNQEGLMLIYKKVTLIIVVYYGTEFALENTNQ